MSKLVVLPGEGTGNDLSWSATNALFDDVVVFIRRRVRDQRAAETVTTQAASGYLFLAELPEPVLTEVLTALRDDLPAYVNEVIYPPEATCEMDYPDTFIARAKFLAYLADRSISLRGDGVSSSRGSDQASVVVARTDPGIPLQGRLLYQDDGDVEFLCAPESRADKLARTGSDGSVSLRIGSLQLEVGIITHQVLYARGYCPRESWNASRFDIPDMPPGVVSADPDHPFVPGQPLALDRPEEWLVDHDARSGWLRISSPGNEGRGTLTLIADGIAVGTHAEEIVSVWLHTGP
ncbi:hypothetical protein AB0451_36820 [Streptomyces sp. NPDC052000]|uniref:hypothetical protein n=1 Tax=Streptomyces sp. NPDC052000 TaxID=3155676 RepID=UPI00344C47C2